MKLVIFGPQGSGKGTQAKVLSQFLKIPHISTGNILRQEIAANSGIGRQVKSLVEKGDLLPDQLILEIAAKRISQPDCQNGFILDGFPRTSGQAEGLQKISPIDYALEIWISDDEAFKRIATRRYCSKCGANISIAERQGSGLTACDQCGGQLLIRDDDQPAAIRERLFLYHEEAVKLKSFYLKLNSYVRVDGVQEVSEVTENIFQALGLSGGE